MYFYTATIHEWRHLIGKHQLQHIILDTFTFLSEKKRIRVYGFVIMPNHLHVIWTMLKTTNKESAVSSFMKYTAHRFQEYLQQNVPWELPYFKVNLPDRKYNFWQRGSDQFLLYNTATIAQKLNYIHENPLQEHWQLANEPALYPYSSAMYYEQGVKNYEFLHDYRD
ncbi:transposase [Deminuibacter soli]|nr:transposase [Deminuibacter soli]